MSASADIFAHVKKGAEDLSRPARHHSKMDAYGWLYDAETVDPRLNGKSKDGLWHEMNDTLTILTEEERFLLAADNTLAQGFGDMVALDFNERLARASIAVKGQGRKDLVDLFGRVTQSISIPTTMQKIRRIFSNKGGKEQEERPVPIDDE